MKFRKRTLLYISGAALLATSVVGCHRYTPEERGEMVVEKITQELVLNETQQSNLSAIKTELLELRKSMKDQRDQTKTDIQAMLEQPTLDRNQLNAIVNQYVNTVQSRSPVIIDAIGNFYDSLDDTQRAEVKAFIDDKMDHHHRHHHHW